MGCGGNSKEAAGVTKSVQPVQPGTLVAPTTKRHPPDKPGKLPQPVLDGMAKILHIPIKATRGRRPKPKVQANPFKGIIEDPVAAPPGQRSRPQREKLPANKSQAERKETVPENPFPAPEQDDQQKELRREIEGEEGAGSKSHGQVSGVPGSQGKEGSELLTDSGHAADSGHPTGSRLPGDSGHPGDSAYPGSSRHPDGARHPGDSGRQVDSEAPVDSEGQEEGRDVVPISSDAWVGAVPLDSLPPDRVSKEYFGAEEEVHIAAAAAQQRPTTSQALAAERLARLYNPDRGLSPEPPEDVSDDDEEYDGVVDEARRQARLAREKLSEEEAQRLAAERRAEEERLLAQKSAYMDAKKNEAANILSKYQ